ncbi:MAG TPA: hypothetical protein VGR19_02375 [Allosphingosinicella sp.]|nr:hypothetical protein [Allosphingosinicella sp.]
MADDRYGNRGRGSYRRSDSIFSDDDRRDYRRSGHEGGGRGSSEERGFFQRAGEEVKSWFSDDDDDRGRSSERSSRSDYGAYDRGRSSGDRRETWGGGSDWPSRGGGQRGGSSPFDDHYMSWRERQISQLDRDYEEYCRDRQKQFETDFHSWRQQRQGRSGGQSEGAPGTAGEVTSGRTGLEGQKAGSGSTTRISDGDEGASAATTAGGGGELSASESSTGSSATTASGGRAGRRSQDSK